MNIYHSLIIIKGEDKTREVIKWKYEKNNVILITYSNGKSYPYSCGNVRIESDPESINVFNNHIYKENKLLYNLKVVLQFKKLNRYRIIYNTDYSEIVEKAKINIVASCLNNRKSKECFNYLKEIAESDSLTFGDNSGVSILGNIYRKLNFISEDSILSSYLCGEIESNKGSININVPITYPFGFNLSQKKAVENALNNRISVIEGPPGTGKTQTILNIISNLVIRGKSVAVVSSNNSAIQNVYDKLEKNNLDFISAFLGNSDNKKSFINSQSTGIKEIEAFNVVDDKISRIKEDIKKLEAELNLMLEYKNKLSLLKQTYNELCTEQKYFDVYYSDTFSIKKPIIKFLFKSSDKLLEALFYLQNIIENQGKLNFYYKLYLLFKLGIIINKRSYVKIDEIIAYIQNNYYKAKLNELNLDIQSFSEKLKSYNFEEKMKNYTDMSMILLKKYLYIKYNNHKRKTYSIDDLWKDSHKFIDDYPVILSTTFSLRNSLSNSYCYDYVIIDESSQVNLTTGSLALSCAKNAVIVGDLKQLTCVISNDDKRITDSIFNKYELPECYRFSENSLLSSVTSLFKDIPQILLKEHYRCSPKIIEFCNKKFYDNQLIILTDNDKGKDEMLVYRTTTGNHARERYNQREIDVIKKEIITQQNIDINKKNELGIVTPYRKQTEKLKKEFEGTNVKVDTVDKFQGQERNIIILSTVDNEISEFTDMPNRLNVAVSRAIKQLILVTTADEKSRDTNIGDLIKYIEYNSFQIIKSQIYSVFDYLYEQYTEKRNTLLKKMKKISEYDSENLMYLLIKNILKHNKFSNYSVAVHIPLKMIINDFQLLNEKEYKYAMNNLTHVDFLIFNKMDKKPVLIIEVDGITFHNEYSKQFNRDIIKNSIFEKYHLEYIRLKTNESNEKERIIEKLNKISINV